VTSLYTIRIVLSLIVGEPRVFSPAYSRPACLLSLFQLNLSICLTLRTKERPSSKRLTNRNLTSREPTRSHRINRLPTNSPTNSHPTSRSPSSNRTPSNPTRKTAANHLPTASPHPTAEATRPNHRTNPRTSHPTSPARLSNAPPPLPGPHRRSLRAGSRNGSPATVAHTTSRNPPAARNGNSPTWAWAWARRPATRLPPRPLPRRAWPPLQSRNSTSSAGKRTTTATVIKGS
jgi:hypothetical protein